MARTYAGRALDDLPQTDLAWTAYWRSVGYLTSEQVPIPPAPAGAICSECGEVFAGGEQVHPTERRMLVPARWAHSGEYPACVNATEPGTPARRRVLALLVEQMGYEVDEDLMRLVTAELRSR